jgi:hypothetical protein
MPLFRIQSQHAMNIGYEGNVMNPSLMAFGTEEMSLSSFKLVCIQFHKVFVSFI